MATYLHRAREPGLDCWPLPSGRDDDATLKQVLFQRVGRPPRDLTEPDWPKMAAEMKRKGVTLVTLVLLWDRSNLVAQLADLATPEMSTSASFHRNDASRKLAEKLQDLCAPQLLAQNRLAGAVRTVNLKHILCQPIGDCYAFACQQTNRVRPWESLT